jgi:hypothetical protein
MVSVLAPYWPAAEPRHPQLEPAGQLETGVPPLRVHAAARDWVSSALDVHCISVQVSSAGVLQKDVPS